MNKKNIGLMFVGNHHFNFHYINLSLFDLFPFYLTTDGNETIIETKLDEIIDKYDEIYLLEDNEEYECMLRSFLKSTKEKLKKYKNVFVLSFDEMYKKNFVGVNYIDWNTIRNEFEQCEYLKKLNSENKCRFFNEIKFDDDKVIKIAKTNDAIKLQEIENDFYNAYGNISCLCGRQGYDRNKHALILNRVDGITAQKWYYKYGNPEKLISKVIAALHTLNDTEIDIEDDDEDIRKAFYNELITKISQRVMPCKMLIDHFINKTNVKKIDNMAITTDFDTLINSLKKWYENNEMNFNACLCHGDPNTDNTMIDKDDNVIFIDPRGYFGNLKTIGLGMAEYDIAKFCYGLNGYSKFNSAPYIEIDNEKCKNDNNIVVRYPGNDCASITRIDLDEMPIDINIKIIIGIIWMKLTSYIINDPMKGIIAYLYGNAICTKYLKQLGYL